MNKKILLIGFLLVLLISIPVILFLLTQQTNTRSKAAKSTNLTFSTLSGPVNTGDNFSLNVLLDPGQNQVSFVKLLISYDKTKIKRGDPGISPNTSVFPVILEGPTYDQCTGTSCIESITLSIGTEVTKAIQGGGSPVTIASLNFKALAATDPTAGTPISFANGTQVLSLASTDQPSENVLASANAATIIVAGPTPTPTPTATPVPTTPVNNGTTTTTTDTPTPTATTSANQNPLCTSLTADNTSTDSAPLAVLFTANGSDPDGTITKVSFNFGDGSVQDVTSAGGIGTNTVNAQVSHTYQTTGIFTANATLTDDANGISNPTTCSQTITVGSVQPTTLAMVTPTPTLPTNKPLPPTGPGDKFVIFGTVGAIVATLGGFILFGL